jgi:hypothetical protein
VPTRDPFSGDPVVVTRVENPATGTVFEGRFSLGWVGLLTQKQIDLVGLLLARRNNLHRLAADLGISYNTARARLDEIVVSLGGAGPQEDRSRETVRRSVLERVASGELSPADALESLDDEA